MNNISPKVAPTFKLELVKHTYDEMLAHLNATHVHAWGPEGRAIASCRSFVSEGQTLGGVDPAETISPDMRELFPNLSHEQALAFRRAVIAHRAEEVSLFVDNMVEVTQALLNQAVQETVFAGARYLAHMSQLPEKADDAISSLNGGMTTVAVQLIAVTRAVLSQNATHSIHAMRIAFGYEEFSGALSRSDDELRAEARKVFELLADAYAAKFGIVDNTLSMFIERSPHPFALSAFCPSVSAFASAQNAANQNNTRH